MMNFFGIRLLACAVAMIGLIAIAGCEGGSSSSFQPRQQGVSGVVVDGYPYVGLATPSPNTVVRAYRANNDTIERFELVATSRTDAKGEFFIALEPGDYQCGSRFTTGQESAMA